MNTKKEKNNKDPSAERMEALREAYRKEAEAYKNRVRPLVKFLRQHRLRFTTAHVGNERV